MHPLERRSEQIDAQQLGFGLRHDAPSSEGSCAAAALHTDVFDRSGWLVQTAAPCPAVGGLQHGSTEDR